MQVTYFRTAREGPEARIENAVLRSANTFVSGRRQRTWAAASLRIGAGMPDVLIVVGKPQISVLAGCSDGTAELLGYVAAIGKANYSAIVEHHHQRIDVPQQLELLLKAKVIRRRGDIFTIRAPWRGVLPEIVSIEAKVTNWKRALQQALRNRIFTHRSYVALPIGVAERVSSSLQWAATGIGLLSVSETGVVKLAVSPKVHEPQVWSYYYRIASVMARNVDEYAVHSSAADRAS